MGMMDFCYGVVNTVVDCTANILDGVGSLACLAGGLGYAASNLMNEEIVASYLAELQTQGYINVGINIAELNARQTFHVPVNGSERFEDGWAFDVDQLLKKDSLLTASSLSFGAGAMLKILGKTLRLWQRGAEDQRHFENKDEINLSAASWMEYVLIASQAVIESTSLALYSAGIINTIVNALGLPESSLNLTFPTSGENSVNNNSTYSGPLGHQNLNINIHEAFNIPLTEHDHSTPLNIKIDISASIRSLLTYGAGLLFHSEEKKSNAWPAVIAAGYTCGMAASFFNRKQRNMRDERVNQSLKEYYQNTPETIELLNTFV